MIEKIGFANRTDIGDFLVSIKITNGVTTSYLAKNLIILDILPLIFWIGIRE